MAVKNKVNSTTGQTTTSTTTSQWQVYNYQRVERGWECPRCNRINAPWVRQCDCSGNNWTITSDWTYRPEWWKEVTYNSDTFKVHPDSTIYQVGGSDYKDGNTYVNVSGTQSNTTDPSATYAWNNNLKTETIHNGKTNYNE